MLSELGFDPDDDGPVLAMIGRLDPQKGFDLLAGAAPELVAEGAGWWSWARAIPSWSSISDIVAAKHPRSVAVIETSTGPWRGASTPEPTCT